MRCRTRRAVPARGPGRTRAARPEFPRVVALFFTAQLLLMLLHALALLFGTRLAIPLISGLPPLYRRTGGFSWVDDLQLASSALSALLILGGILRILSGARLRALRLFRYSVIVTVVLTQPFMFFHHQWLALSVLAYNLLLLPALNFAIAHEAR